MNLLNIKGIENLSNLNRDVIKTFFECLNLNEVKDFETLFKYNESHFDNVIDKVIDINPVKYAKPHFKILNEHRRNLRNLLCITEEVICEKEILG